MKKQILKLLNEENGRLKINKICSLHRWQKDGLNQKVDRLEIEFSLLSVSDKSIEIEERDFKEIIKRIEKEQTIFMKEITEKLNSNLRCGYIN